MDFISFSGAGPTAGGGLVFLRYQPEIATGILTGWGSHALESGRYSRAIRYYGWAYQLSGRTRSLPSPWPMLTKQPETTPKRSIPWPTPSPQALPPCLRSPVSDLCSPEQAPGRSLYAGPGGGPRRQGGAGCTASRPSHQQLGPLALQSIYECDHLRPGEAVSRHGGGIPLPPPPPTRVPFLWNWAKPPFGRWL